jgi:hypothetical protein
MSRSALSIHPLGGRYGIVPENEIRSVVELQYDLAAHRAEPNFSCVVWIPPGTKAVEDRQRALLDRIRNQRADATAVELLETSLEELKNFVIDPLRRPPAEKPAPSLKQSNGSAPLGRVYLVHDQSDSVAATPIRDYLDTRGFEVIRPLMKGEPQELREDHQENLRLADGVLVYCGAASEAWLRSCHLHPSTDSASTRDTDLEEIRSLPTVQAAEQKTIRVGRPNGPWSSQKGNLKFNCSV